MGVAALLVFRSKTMQGDDGHDMKREANGGNGRKSEGRSTEEHAEHCRRVFCDSVHGVFSQATKDPKVLCESEIYLMLIWLILNRSDLIDLFQEC